MYEQFWCLKVFEVSLVDPKLSLDCKRSVGTVLKIFRRVIAEVQNSRDRRYNGLICLYIRSRPFEKWRICGCCYFSRCQKVEAQLRPIRTSFCRPFVSAHTGQLEWVSELFCNDDTMGWAVNRKTPSDNRGTYQKPHTTHFRVRDCRRQLTSRSWQMSPGSCHHLE